MEHGANRSRSPVCELDEPFGAVSRYAEQSLQHSTRVGMACLYPIYECEAYFLSTPDRCPVDIGALQCRKLHCLATGGCSGRGDCQSHWHGGESRGGLKPLARRGFPYTTCPSCQGPATNRKRVRGFCRKITGERLYCKRRCAMALTVRTPCWYRYSCATQKPGASPHSHPSPAGGRMPPYVREPPSVRLRLQKEPQGVSSVE